MKPLKISQLRILRYPNPLLKQVCLPVGEFGSELKALTDRMLELMREERGVGLAAPQVGVLLRVFVCNPTGEPGDDLVCVNPRFEKLLGEAEQAEGCLSIPGVSVTVRRAARAVMVVQDMEGIACRLEGSDLLARVWQHETDHLEGRLIIDRMTTEDELANRKTLKQLKAEFAAAKKR